MSSGSNFGFPATEEPEIKVSHPSKNESAEPKLFTQHEDLDTPEYGEPKIEVQTEIDQIQNPTSFYDKDGRILNPAHAEKVAYALKEEGMDKAILVEQALKREFDTGLTQEQEYNRTILEGLLEKYPNVFKRIILEDGTIAAFKKEHFLHETEKVPYPALLLTDNGMLTIMGNDPKTPVENCTSKELTKLFDDAKAGKWKGFEKPDTNTYVRDIIIRDIITDFGTFSCRFVEQSFRGFNEEIIKGYGATFKLLEERALEEKQRDFKQSAKNILDLL